VSATRSAFDRYLDDLVAGIDGANRRRNAVRRASVAAVAVGFVALLLVGLLVFPREGSTGLRTEGERVPPADQPTQTTRTDDPPGRDSPAVDLGTFDVTGSKGTRLRLHLFGTPVADGGEVISIDIGLGGEPGFGLTYGPCPLRPQELPVTGVGVFVILPRTDTPAPDLLSSTGTPLPTERWDHPDLDFVLLARLTKGPLPSIRLPDVPAGGEAGTTCTP